MFAMRTFMLFAAVLCAATALPSRSGAADDATALLAKHAAFVGWKAGDGNIKTLREKGNAERDGKVVLQFSRLQEGVIYRDSSSRASATFENGFTGNVFWQSNVNGFTIKTVGDVVKYLVTQIAIDNEALAGVPLTVRGNATVDGVQTTIVRATPEVGLPVDLYIDPQSGAYKRVAINPNGKYAESYDVLAYTDVGNGKRVVSSWRYVGSTATYRITDIQANTEITPAELHPPAPKATWTFAPPSQTAPIYVTDKRIYLDATVNGHPGHFVFDTGAAVIAFTDSFARVAGAKRSGESRISGVGGGARANVYNVDTMVIAGSTLSNVTINTGLDESVYGGEKVDGFIGFDVLAGAIVDMDLDAQTVRILDPTQVVPDRNAGIMVGVDLTTGQPRFPMTVGHRVPVLATIDSGNEAYTLFNQDLVTHDHVTFFSDPNSPGARMGVRGVNGTEFVECGELESLEFGPVSYRPVPACKSTFMRSNNVLVGYEFFKNFNYVIDYPDSEILMTPRKKR